MILGLRHDSVLMSGVGYAFVSNYAVELSLFFLLTVVVMLLHAGAVTMELIY